MLELVPVTPSKYPTSENSQSTFPRAKKLASRLSPSMSRPLARGRPLPLKPFVALLRWQQRALFVPTPGQRLTISATAVSCPAKRELPSPPVSELLMSVFSVLCKSGNVFLCIWRHCKIVSVFLYLWHFISPRVNAKLQNLLV